MSEQRPTTQAERAREARRRLEGKRIAVVPYSHSDWAWVHTRHWHARRYALVFADVLEMMRRAPEFRWYFDTVACQTAPLLEHRPDLLPELRQRVKEGRIAVCGGYANVRPQMVGDETFVRSLQIGRREFAALFPGADLSVHADAVDVATGHPQLPQVLRQAGYRCLRIWRPYAAMSLKGVPNEFVWRGLDGSEILTSRGIYGSLWALREEHACLREPEKADRDAFVAALWDAELEERQRFTVGSQVFLAYGSDDARPGRMLDDTPFDILGLVRRWNASEKAPIRFATPVEYFTELEKERDALPRIVGTLDPCDVAYNAAWNGEKGLAVRRVENDRRLVQAETFAALAESHGMPWPAELLDSLWKDHLRTCAHATQWLYTEDFAHMRRLADRVEIEAEAVRSAAMDQLVQCMDLPEDAVCVVFNPLPFARRAPVAAMLSGYGAGWPLALCDAKGAPLPAQPVEDFTGQGGFPEQRVLAMADLPPLGYTVLRQRLAEKAYTTPAAGGEMDNGRLRLTFAGNRLTGVRDRATGRAWDAPEDAEWGGLFLRRVATNAGPLHVGPITGETGCAWTTGELTERGPVRWRCRRQGRIGDVPVTLDTLLHAGEPRVEFALSLDWPGPDGFLAARVPLPGGVALWGDIPFGVERKEIEKEPYGRDHTAASHSMERTREGMFYARSFVACDGPDGRGFAFVHQNTDRFYIRHPDGGSLEHILINSVATLEDWERHVEPSTLGGRGLHTFRWSLLFYQGDWRAAQVVRQAAMARAEPITRDARRDGPPPAARLAPEQALLAVEPDHVSLSAVYREGERLCLRLHETHGEPATARLRLHREVMEANAVDLSGAPMPDTPVSVASDVVAVRIGPWQIATLRLRTT